MRLFRIAVKKIDGRILATAIAFAFVTGFSCFLCASVMLALIVVFMGALVTMDQFLVGGIPSNVSVFVLIGCAALATLVPVDFGCWAFSGLKDITDRLIDTVFPEGEER